MRLQDFTAPGSPVARAAYELAATCHTPALLHHVVRSWLWAEAFALVEGRPDADRELLYVAAVLHDLGSTNGTTVNGSSVQTWQLADGDVIHIGHSTVVFSSRY